jgi:hypothetical protein
MKKNCNPNLLIRAALILALLLPMAACRRPLFLYQDQFKQVQIQVDWRNYDRDKVLYPHTPDPGGMTLWFYPDDGSKSYSFTTTEVNRYDLYLPRGGYTGVVIDYSPDEYGMQEFLGMDYANTARVQSKPSPYQPIDLDDAPLYGVSAYAGELPSKEAGTGLWTISYHPEPIASDTVRMNVLTGAYVNYIPFEERNTYQESLVKQVFQMTPLLLPWHMRVRIPVKGIYYAYQLDGSIAGMADGYFLAEAHTSLTPCLMQVTDWELYVTGDNEGYIAATFDTWGMRYNLWSQYDVNLGGKPFQVEAPAPEVRINVKFLLRDRRTVRYYHFDVGNQVYVYPNEYALSVDLRGVLPEDEIPDLPYVEGVNGIDFDGVVVPWEPTEEVIVDF